MAERTLDTPSFVPNGTDLCDCDASNPDGQDEEILSTDRQVKTFRGRGPRDPNFLEAALRTLCY